MLLIETSFISRAKMSFHGRIFYNSNYKRYTHRKSELEILKDKIQVLENKVRTLEKENFNLRVNDWLNSNFIAEKKILNKINQFKISYL